ncbi:hypothetical protein C6Q14_08160 [Burkholderia ambifaria]|jgi:hypothetical protein|uniref:YXWGXW repeat-containing protein n=1 Tax=Burkholderia ambifaria TaxID=152480 RepID=UPI000CFEF79B|nr:YXWGXW repeat-containing protein [Burkholderia ambifaria]PRG08395.1 hypothetical protein C6Q14_08160 [Burkholderia ambifaria]
MKIRSVSLAVLVSASAALMSACVVEPARPPQPAPVVEVAPPPAPGYRWVKGHYRWAGNHWAWVPGHWVAVY